MTGDETPDAAELAQIVDLFGERVGELSKRVEGLARLRDDDADAEPTAVTDWPALSADEAAERLLRLADWVEDVLVETYFVTRKELPDCWAMHRPAIVHLLWLQDSYESAYGPDGVPLAVNEWNVRWRPSGLDLLRQVVPTKHCRPRAGREGWHLTTADRADEIEKREAAEARRTAAAQRAAAPPPPPPPPLSPAEQTMRRAQEAGRNMPPNPRTAPEFPLSAGDAMAARQRPAAETKAAEKVVTVDDPAFIHGAPAERRWWQGYVDQGIVLDGDWRASRARARRT